ncbi:organic cation transporter protein [Trichonephila clavipes]|nr:organic cation transporter protein [Trichonephila clavipes]
MEKQNASVKAAEKKEDIMNLVRGEGPWQRKILLVIMLIAVPLASHNLAMSFFAPNLDHWCARPPGSNLSVEEWKDLALPPRDRHCSRYKFIYFTDHGKEFFTNFTSSELVPCDSWEYDDSIYVSSVLSEWNLVCDREWFISLSKSIFIAGYMCSVTIFGFLADKFGRRPIVAACNAIALIAAIICACSTSFFMFAIARFFIAVGVSGAFNTAFVLLMEIIGPEYRSKYGLIVNLGWNFGYISLPGVARMLGDWFWIQLCITVPNILLLSTWWLLPESPRWLLTHGKVDLALEVLSKAGKTNGINFEDVKSKVEEAISKTSKEHENENASANVLQLLKPGLWKTTLIIFYNWCVIAFVYYGISYNTNELAGDPFLNFALYGLIEIPANILSLFAIQYKGRRNPTAITLAAAGASCLLIYFIPNDPWWLGVSLSLFGKFCISCAFGIIYVFTAEIFNFNFHFYSLFLVTGNVGLWVSLCQNALES